MEIATLTTVYDVSDTFLKHAHALRDQAIHANASYALVIDRPFSSLLTLDSWSLAIEAFLTGLYSYKRRTQDLSVVIMCEAESLLKYVSSRKAQFITVAQATHQARRYVDSPSNLATPTHFKTEALRMARNPGMKVRIFDLREQTQKGLGLMASVGRSGSPPYFVHMSHRAKKKTARRLAIVAKGVTFDTGGLQLKPHKDMYGMKSDMGGAAAALACAKALGAIKPEVHVDMFIPFVENNLGSQANKPGDVLVGYSGTSVEIANTDAEGRLILADALAYAVKNFKFDAVLDIGTLTMAYVFGLGDEIGAVFSTSDDLYRTFMAAAHAAGERFWKLPLHEAYRALNKSDVADVKNYAGPKAGTITAALFLKEFVGNVPWLHLDILGPAYASEKRDNGFKGGTGFGVKTLMRWISCYET